MKRRQLIQAISIILGGSLTPGIMAALPNIDHTHHRRKKIQKRLDKSGSSSFLNVDELEFITVLVDTIIPRSDTPGASDVGVPAFIDLMLAEWYEDKECMLFRNGLAAFNLYVQRKYGVRFVDLVADIRHTEIELLDRQVMNAEVETEDLCHFYRMAKELTLIGYYTSAEGMSKELGYRGLVGEFNFMSSGPPGSVTRY